MVNIIFFYFCELFYENTISPLKFLYSKKATKIWQNLQILFETTQ